MNGSFKELGFEGSQEVGGRGGGLREMETPGFLLLLLLLFFVLMF